MYNDRSTMGYSKFTGFTHGIHRVEHIFAITMNNLQILKTGKIISILPGKCLILFGNRDTVPIILPYKYHRKTFPTGPVNRLVNISFRRSRLSMRSNRHPLMSIIHHGTRHSGSMKIMRSGSGRHIFYMPFGFSKVVGHMTSSTAGISCFRNTIQYQFLHTHACRKHGQHIAIVWKKEVLSFGKDLTYGQLDSVMPRIRRMIGPTQ